MQRTPLYNGHYFEVLMECAVERFHCTPILINAIYFLFICKEASQSRTDKSETKES